MQQQTRRAAPAALVAIALVLGGCGGDDDGDDTQEQSNREQSNGEQSDEGSSTAGVDGRSAAATGAGALAIVGDGGELNDDTLDVAALIDRHDVAAVFTVGDNEYTTEGRTVASFAESVGDVYGPWLDADRFFPIPGDHDYGDACDDEDAGADLDAYLEYFELPVGPEDETYYDVRVGDVHVFALDTLVGCHRDGGAKLERERTWLAAAAGASDAPLKIALLHNPPYSSGTSHGSFEGLRWDFAEWGIDLVVAGDDHIYERSAHDGVVYVVNGLGGVEAHELGDPIAGSEVLSADRFGALFVTTSDDGAAVSFVTVDDEVIDEFALDGGDDGRGRFGAAAPDEAGTEVVPPPPGDTRDTGDAVSAALETHSSWTWQLLGDVDTSVDADVYDIDLFDVSDDVIAELHADGRIVVCYFSAGSFEEWRTDAGEFDEDALGEPLDDWEGERWLDIRSPGVRAIIEQRLDLAAERGCDGVEPDNVDGFGNDTGFDLASDDQLAFNRFVAQTARDRGLLVGLKNDLDQVDELVDDFDFAVNEQCHEYDECELLAPFLDVGKPVFNAEYASDYVDDPHQVCTEAIERGMRTVILPLDLDGSFRVACDER